ncbi:MAG: hypothetical protein E3J72_13380, partial [Planctomycetota bacterium]
MKRSRNPNRPIILLAIIVTVIGFHLFPLFAAEHGSDEATPTHEEKSDAGHGEAAPSGEKHAEEEHGGGHGGVMLKVLFAIILILFAAKLGGEVFERMNQPGVIGELLFGVLIGNVGLLCLMYGGSNEYLAGFGEFVDWMKEKDMPIDVLAEIGVIFLLFEVGLETNVKEMMSVGLSSLLVALFGVIVP